MAYHFLAGVFRVRVGGDVMIYFSGVLVFIAAIAASFVVVTIGTRVVSSCIRLRRTRDYCTLGLVLSGFAFAVWTELLWKPYLIAAPALWWMETWTGWWS